MKYFEYCIRDGELRLFFIIKIGFQLNFLIKIPVNSPYYEQKGMTSQRRKIKNITGKLF